MIKLLEPVKFTAEYRITTPLFLGGAFPGEGIDNQQMRNASLKGALRFWWRALNWGRELKACNGDVAAALKALHTREGELFGRSSDGKDSVQSQVQLTSQLSDVTTLSAGDKSVNSFSYLLGLGLYRGGILRPALSAGSLTVTARFKASASAQDHAGVREALIALGLFGGLGSRARKGLGSLSIQQVQDGGETLTIRNDADIRRFVAGLDISAPGTNAPLTAFTDKTRIDLSPGGRSASACLKQISQCLQLYRDGTVPNHERECNFPNDRALAVEAVRGQSVSALPARAAFGLPHNYSWIGTKDKLDIAPAELTRNRRASPLFIHIHQYPDGNCSLVQALFPAIFLPEGSTVELKGKRTTLVHNPSIDFGVIRRFMDRFTQENKGEVLRHGN